MDQKEDPTDAKPAHNPLDGRTIQVFFTQHPLLSRILVMALLAGFLGATVVVGFVALKWLQLPG